MKETLSLFMFMLQVEKKTEEQGQVQWRSNKTFGVHTECCLQLWFLYFY